jgi:ankyrin repeat protein
MNNLQIFEVLRKQKNFDVNMKQKNGKTALHICCEYGNLDVMKTLVKLANIDAQDDKGNASIHYTIHYNTEECLQLLLENAADKRYQTNL